MPRAYIRFTDGDGNITRHGGSSAPIKAYFRRLQQKNIFWPYVKFPLKCDLVINRKLRLTHVIKK